MFLNLPCELQHDIFDRLTAIDRTRLNIALPKTNKIRKTTKTDTNLDRRLGVIQYYLKKKKRAPSGSIEALLRKHIDDPTAAELLSSTSILVNEPIKTPTELALAQIASDMCQNRVAMASFEKLGPAFDWDMHAFDTLDKHSRALANDLAGLCYKLETPALQSMLDNPCTLAFLRSVCRQDNLFFKLINRDHPSMIEFVLNNREALGITQYHIDYVQKDNIMQIFTSIDQIKILRAHFHVTDRQYQAWLDTAFMVCNIEIINFLMNKCGIRLNES